MPVVSRAVGAVFALGIALTVTACGSDVPAAGKPAATARPAETTAKGPITPGVAEPTVAATPTEASAVKLFGQDGIEAGYRELVELATHLAFNPKFFLHDADNNPSDLDPVLAGRMHQNQADHIRAQAAQCDDSHTEACADVMSIVYYDLALSKDENALTYRPDGQFVTEQSITAPTVTTRKVGGQDSLHFEFDHTAHVRVLAHGTPISITMARHVAYDLWPAPPGNATRYWIVNWHVNYHGDARDEATGQPFHG